MKRWLRRLADAAAFRMGGPIAEEVERRLFLEPRFVELLGTKTLETLDVRKFAQVLAAFEAAEFYGRHLYDAEYYEDHLEHLRAMARRACAGGEGLFLEFGVASGATIRAIAEASGRPVAGFDSFQGLPEDWRYGVRRGAFAGPPPELPAGITLHVGLIQDTLPAFVAALAPAARIAFIHVDTDLYAPAKCILAQCRPFMRDTIVVFDEFLNYPGWRDHEHRALIELQAESPELDIRYLALGGRNAVSVLVGRR